MTSRVGTGMALLVVLGACSHDWAATGDGGETADADHGDGDALLDDGEAGNDGEASDDGTTNDGADLCGNGEVDPGEQCESPSSEGCSVGMCTGMWSCGTDCRWTACDLGAAPPGDACGSVIENLPVSDSTAIVVGTTCGARDDYVATTCDVAPGGADVVYRLVLETRREVTFELSASFRSVLYLWSGDACPGDDRFCSVDDDPTDSDPNRLVATLDAGVYWLVVDGAAAEEAGGFSLSTTAVEATPPANDACTSAATLSLPASGGPALSVSGTTRHATTDSVGCGSVVGGPDVWYRLTLLAPTVLYLDLLDGETWASTIAIYPDGCGSSATPSGCSVPACGTNRGRWVGVLAAGTYLVAIGGATAADSGPFTLRAQLAQNWCNEAEPMLADGRYEGSTMGVGGRVLPDCGGGPRSAGEAAYYVPLCAGAVLSATTCDTFTDFDTVLLLRAGNCAGWTTTDLACNDDATAGCTVAGDYTSEFEVTITDSGLYFLIVDGTSKGMSPDEGDFGLWVTGVGP